MKTIGIFPNTEKDIDFLGTARVINALRGKTELLMHRELSEILCRCLGEDVCSDVRFVEDGELFSRPDVMVTLGGDGTIIKAARQCAESRIPILGINLGRVGYLAELELDELYLLDRVIADEYKAEKRMMIEVDTCGGRHFALNEAVIGAASIFRIVELELYCNGKKVNKYRADGIIASTPTGSTAYSMSAGGAVVDPGMEAILVTPICSHSLNAMPLIFSAESELEIKNVTAREPYLVVSIDGAKIGTLSYGETLRIRRCPEAVNLIRLKDGGFWDVLRHKMADS